MHLDLPEDVALAPTNEQVAGAGAAGEACRRTRRRDRARGGADRRGASGRSRCSARRPCGSPIRSCCASVIERHNLPFATTTMAKGMIDEDHPLSLGCIERACRQVQRKLLRSADLIVGLGYDTIEVEYEAWIGDVPLLQIDIEPVDVAPSVKLVHQVDRRSRRRRWRGSPRCRQPPIRGRTDDARRASPRLPGGAAAGERNTFTAHAAIDAVRRALPRDGLLSFDVGAHTHQIASQWTAHAPKTFHITNGWSSMGFGLPGAIAAKLARPDLPVVCLLGDGCFQMTCGEVATAKRLGHHAADRRARRPLARADQGQADPPPVPALRHRAAGGGLPRAAGALFRRAGGRRATAPMRSRTR